MPRQAAVAIRAPARRPRQVTPQRGLGRLLAHGSGSSGHVRELSFPDVGENLADGCVPRRLAARRSVGAIIERS